MPSFALLGFAIAAVVTGVAVVVVGKKSPTGATSTGHVIGAKGWVEADPRALALAAGVSDNTYALASMMRSEAGEDAFAQYAVGWTARNKATAQGVSVFKLLTRAGRNKTGTRTLEPHESHGFYGPQNVGPRYASTRKAPTSDDLDRAAEVLSGEVSDPTEGATQFDAPAAQDKWVDVVAGYTKTAQQIAEERSRGAEMVMIPGIPHTRFWRPRSSEDEA